MDVRRLRQALELESADEGSEQARVAAREKRRAEAFLRAAAGGSDSSH